MELTIDFIRKNFIEFNKTYFDNSLKEPQFKITNCKSTLGQCHWENSYDFVNNRRICRNFEIRISDYFDRCEKDIQNTILHEMIHLYIRQNNIKDTRPHHGQVFYDWANRINAYGWHIARTDSITGVKVKERNKSIYVMVSYACGDGRYFMFRISPNAVTEWKNYLNSKYIFFREWVMFTSTNDEQYASFTCCRSRVRGRYISAKEHESHKLNGMYFSREYGFNKELKRA